jgi:hypothetical protein
MARDTVAGETPASWATSLNRIRGRFMIGYLKFFSLIKHRLKLLYLAIKSEKSFITTID